MKVVSSDDCIDSHGIKCVIFGASGVGKTRSIISLVSAGFKPILISGESGLLSLRGNAIPTINLLTDDSGKEILPAKRFERLAEVYKWLKAGQKEYDTIFCDSLTEFNEILMAFLSEKYPDRKDSLAKYQENSERMKKLIRDFRDLPYNVVLASTVDSDKDDIGRKVLKPGLVGKVSDFLPYYFDEVFYLHTVQNEKKETVSKFQTSSTPDVSCKDRSGKLKQIEEYDLGKMFLKINNKGEKI